MPTSEQKTYSTFCVLWGLATLFHLVAQDPWPAPLLSTLLAAAALYLLHRPAAPPRLVLLAALQVCESWTTAPFISNYWLFTGLVNLTLLQAYAPTSVGRAHVCRGAGGLVPGLCPHRPARTDHPLFLRRLPQLNADFLDPQTSCAVHFYAAQLQSLPSPWQERPHLSYPSSRNGHSAPAVLASYPQRRYLLGLLFHAAVGFNPLSEFYNFSSMVFALLFLFASLRLDAGWPARPLWGLPRWESVPFPGKSALAVGAAVGALGLLVALNDLFAAPAELVLPLWGLYCAGLILLFVLLPKAPPARPAFSFRPWSVLLVPLLAGLNGCSPYLGLKTETAFAMYSNLRTEGGQSNHLLVPAGVQPFGFQRDLLQIKASSSGFLASLGRRKLMLPFFEVRALLQQHPNTSLTYERYAGSSTPPSTQLRQPIPWPLRKLLYFRPVAHTGRQPCFH